MSDVKTDPISSVEASSSTAGANQEDQIILAWPGRVKLLFNRQVWSSVLLAFGAAGLLFALIFGLATRNASAVLIMVGGCLAFLLVIYILIGIVVDLFGGFRVDFALTDRGVRSLRGKGGNAVSTVAIVVGLLASSRGTVRAGVLSESERSVFIPYPDVKKVKISGSYVLVRGGFVHKPIGLYCTADTLDRVVEILKARCPSATFVGG